MKKWLRIIKRFVVSVLLGLVLTIFLLQNTQRSHEYVLNYIQNQFEYQLSSSFTGHIKSIDLFRLRFVFEDVDIQSLNVSQDWSWKAGLFTVSCSLWELLIEGALGVYIDLHSLQTVSASNGLNLAIFKYLMDVFYSFDPDIPIDLKTVNIKDGFLHAYTQDGYYADVWWNSDFERDTIDDRAHFYVSRVRIYSDLIDYIDHLAGVLELHGDDSLHIFTDLRFKNLYSDSSINPYFFTGSWEDGHGNWSLTSLSGNCVTDTFSIIYDDNRYKLDLTGSIETKLIYPLLGTSQEAAIKIEGSYGLRDYCITDAKGIMTFNNLATIYGTIDQLKTEVVKEGQILTGTMTALKDAYSVNGSWLWDNNLKQGSIELINEKIAAIPKTYWIIPPGKLQATCSFNTQLDIDCKLDCICEHEKLNSSMQCIGSLKADRKGFDLNGTLGSYSLSASGISSFPFIQKVQLYQDEQELITAQIDNTKASISADYNFIQQLLPESIKRHSIGEGTLKFDGNLTTQKSSGKLYLTHGSIHVPMTDNFIDSLSCDLDIDVAEKRLVLSDCAIGFHHGTLKSSRMTFLFDQWGDPTFINAPIIIDNWFANWHKHCSSLFSGTLNLKKEQGNISLQGALFMDDGRINQSFISQQMQRMFSGAPMLWGKNLDNISVDLSCITRKPINIDTTLCQTACNIDMHFKGVIRNPDITGTITLIGGELKFPYKSLDISKARLNFIGQKWYDAVVEFYAKNRIKRYLIDMEVSGAIAKPYVHFNSSPALAQEQILALLLGGSQKGALSTSVPAVVIHNAYSWLFGLNGESSQDGTFKQLMRAFNRVHFVPTVSKKGLGGALEIDLTDAFHATIAKDFTNRAQTSLELEYQLNNALSLRGKRDERGDMGADVELRWKF